MKPSKSRLCSSVHLSQIVVGIQRLPAFEIILHSSSARLGGIHAVQIHLIGIHLIIAVSVIKRLRLHEFTLWGRDLVSVVRIRESPYYRGVFFYRKYMRILSGHWKLSLIERCPYFLHESASCLHETSECAHRNRWGAEWERAGGRCQERFKAPSTQIRINTQF